MGLHVLAADLAKWDEADRDALLLPFFADERPLRGAAGLADWRLNGRLSRLLRGKRAIGAPGETVLLPPGRRLRFKRIMLFGLGDSKGYNDDRYRADVRRIRAVAAEAGITEYAIQAPGRATGLIGARHAAELWIEEADRDARDADVTLIDDPAGSKDMAELLRHAR
jgi:Cytosol aminopeptidase family, N-terminal domain